MRLNRHVRRSIGLGLATLLVAGALAIALAILVRKPRVEPGADVDYDTAVASPVLRVRRPRVLFDHGHHNSHSIHGRFQPFARLLRADGCDVREIAGTIDERSLAQCDILIVVNAQGSPDRAESAFTASEVAAILAWVRGGGSFLLAADHHPYGPANRSLAAAFGVELSGGWCDDPKNRLDGTADTGAIVFRRDANLLGEHPIISGRSEQERIGAVGTFTGESLSGPPTAIALLLFSNSAIDQVPIGSRSETKGGVTSTTFETRDSSAAGKCQALALLLGKGRIVVVGEAAMLSAQIDARSGLRFGMNVPGVDNRQFVLNTIRWLARELP